MLIHSIPFHCNLDGKKMITGLGHYLHGVCMWAPSLHGFSLRTLVSCHIPKMYTWWMDVSQLSRLNECGCGCEWTLQWKGILIQEGFLLCSLSCPERLQPLVIELESSGWKIMILVVCINLFFNVWRVHISMFNMRNVLGLYLEVWWCFSD